MVMAGNSVRMNLRLDLLSHLLETVGGPRMAFWQGLSRDCETLRHSRVSEGVGRELRTPWWRLESSRQCEAPLRHHVD